MMYSIWVTNNNLKIHIEEGPISTNLLSGWNMNHTSGFRDTRVYMNAK